MNLNYENGLKILEDCVKRKESESLNPFDLAKVRLLEFLEQKNLFSKDVTAEINEVIYHQLNPLARRLTGKSFSDLCKQSNYEQPGTADNFDLDDIILECEGILWDKCGLIGLGVHCTSHIFLDHFQTRLKKTLGRAKVFTPLTLIFFGIDSVESFLKKSVRQIRQHKLKLCDQDVLLNVLVPNENIASRFWQKITDELNDQFNNRFIVIIAMGTRFSFPKNVIAIPSPCFKRKHIIRWVHTIVDGLLLPIDDKQDVEKNWVNTIMMECSEDNSLNEDNPLDVDLIYGHVTHALENLNQNTALSALQNFLEERKQIYAETPP